MIPCRCALLAVFMLLTGCASRDALGRERIGMANPASVYCVQSGYRLEIRTGADGGQYGACLFPDGAECEEWVFFRGECGGRYRKMPDNRPETIRSEQR
jgi:putative hemolysin